MALLCGIAGLAHAGEGALDPSESRAWHILSQADGADLLQGLASRLAEVLVPSRREEPLWTGVEGGGSLRLDVRVAEEDTQGEIFVGFFSDPRWWKAAPVQVRRFPGPGEYTVTGLPPGVYQLGAVVGIPPEVQAYGVHEAWPEGVEIVAGEESAAVLLVSKEFRDSPNGFGLQRNFCGDWDRVDPTRLITVRTVDREGEPIPYCFVTFVDRDETNTHNFFEAGTDGAGYAYCDQIDGTFSITVQRHNSLPDRWGGRWESRKWQQLRDSRSRPTITVTWDDFPSGTARLVGRVHDQHGRPLDRYFLSLTQERGNRRTWEDFHSFGLRVPVTDADGRFEIGDLPPGEYRIMVRHFDYPTHDWSFDGPLVTLPDAPDAVVECEVEVEAKELRYGLAVFDGGEPVSAGGWTARFTRDRTSPSGGRYFALNFNSDGTFRVSVSQEERRLLFANSQGEVDVYSHANRTARVRVTLNELSTDPERPTTVVLPRPADVPLPDDARGTRRAVPASGIERHDLLTGAATADLELLDVIGRTHRLSDYRGKVVLLNLFATWCGPCMEELPHLVELQTKLEDRGFVVLAIGVSEESADALQDFARRHRPPYTVLVDLETSIRDLADASGRPLVPRNARGGISMPTNVLLDREQRPIFADVGFSDEKWTALQAAIEKALEE